MPGAWRSFRVTVPAGREDDATAALWEAGTGGVEVRAAGDAVVLLAYFTDAPGLAEELQAGLAGIATSVEPAEIPDVDWVARFRESFVSFRAGRFEIIPVWDAARATSPDQLVVDPARAFGTGTHETTRLCLRALEDLAQQRPLGRVLDVGTGTGLLAIAALRLGASRAIGVDIDPESAESATRHAHLNGVSLPVALGDGVAAVRARHFDTVLANLQATLLLPRRDALLAAVRPAGTLVLSGLLVSDVDEVGAAYGAPPDAVRTDGEWAALVIPAS